MFDTIKEVPPALRPPLPTENGPTVSLTTGDQRTYDSGNTRLSNGVEHNDEGSPPPHPKRISPRNSEFSSQSLEPTISEPPPPPVQPNGVPDHVSDGVHHAPVAMDTSTEEPRDRLLSVTEETRVLDEALCRTSTVSTSSLDGINELATSQPSGGSLEGGVASDRSNFEKLESSISSVDMEMGGAMGGASTEAVEVRGKGSSFESSLDEDSHVRLNKMS